MQGALETSTAGGLSPPPYAPFLVPYWLTGSLKTENRKLKTARRYATRGTVGLITSFETTPVGSVIAALPGGQRACWDTAVLTERLVVREWLFL